MIRGRLSSLCVSTNVMEDSELRVGTLALGVCPTNILVTRVVGILNFFLTNRCLL